MWSPVASVNSGMHLLTEVQADELLEVSSAQSAFLSQLPSVRQISCRRLVGGGGGGAGNSQMNTGWLIVPRGGYITAACSRHSSAAQLSHITAVRLSDGQTCRTLPTQNLVLDL